MIGKSWKFFVSILTLFHPQTAPPGIMIAIKVWTLLSKPLGCMITGESTHIENYTIFNCKEHVKSNLYRREWKFMFVWSFYVIVKLNISQMVLLWMTSSVNKLFRMNWTLFAGSREICRKELLCQDFIYLSPLRFREGTWKVPECVHRTDEKVFETAVHISPS